MKACEEGPARVRTGGRKRLPPGRTFLPLSVLFAAAVAAVLAGCGKEEEAPEPGGRPRLGDPAPELNVYPEPPPNKERTFVEPTEEVDEPEEYKLNELVAGSPTVVHFDSASTPLAGRQSRALAELTAKSPPIPAVKFVTVVIGDKPWPSAGAGGTAKIYHARRREALDAYGCDLLPMIVVVDADGKVRHVGAFTRPEELHKVLTGLASR